MQVILQEHGWLAGFYGLEVESLYFAFCVLTSAGVNGFTTGACCAGFKVAQQAKAAVEGALAEALQVIEAAYLDLRNLSFVDEKQRFYLEKPISIKLVSLIKSSETKTELSRRQLGLSSTYFRTKQLTGRCYAECFMEGARFEKNNKLKLGSLELPWPL